MNTRKITARILLYLFLMASLMIAGCGGGGGGDATGDTTGGVTFAQQDLEGTWDVRMLVAGTNNSWWRGTVTVEPGGGLTFNFCDNSDGDGDAACPAAGLVWTINASTGVITESGTGSDPDNHYTMASNKNFIAGTQDQGTTESALLIAQRHGTGYDPNQVQSKSFVFHQLMIGDDEKWEYAVGTTSPAGLVTLTEHVSSAGPESTGVSDVTFAVDANGVVTATGSIGVFNGFLSADKRTIVGTATETGSGTYYHLYVIQITDGQSSQTSDAAGTSYAHALAVGGSSLAPFWAHQTQNITNSGTMDFSAWVCSNPSVPSPVGTTPTITIATNGTSTISGSDFHGQASFDGTFMVGTRTLDTDLYSLMVITK